MQARVQAVLLVAEPGSPDGALLAGSSALKRWTSSAERSQKRGSPLGCRTSLLAAQHQPSRWLQGADCSRQAPRACLVSSQGTC